MANVILLQTLSAMVVPTGVGLPKCPPLSLRDKRGKASKQLEGKWT